MQFVFLAGSLFFGTMTSSCTGQLSTDRGEAVSEHDATISIRLTTRIRRDSGVRRPRKDAGATDAGILLDSGNSSTTSSDSGSAIRDDGGSSTIADAGPLRDSGTSSSTDTGSTLRDGGVPATDSGSATPDAGTSTPDSGAGSSDSGVPTGGAWPSSNAWSWNGSWVPSCPVASMFDEQFSALPPGNWDWDGNGEGNDDANWRNFLTNHGDFDPLMDASGCVYGWNFVPLVPDAGVFDGAAAYYEGSPGVDYIDLGNQGEMGSYGQGNLRDGPDVLIFDRSHTLDFRTGSVSGGALHDDDLVIAGCRVNTDSSWDINTTTVHTGPGSDWLFVRDIERAAVDLGNYDGYTNRTDTNDGNDLGVVRGNSYDFRWFGGGGNDVAVWYIDDNIQSTTWLGPNFFGGGGWESAIWNDPGTDRIVLAIPTSTVVYGRLNTATPIGSIVIKQASGVFIEDAPGFNDPYAKYCIECGTGPFGQKTMIFEYRSANGRVFTGETYFTDFEEIQIGVGAGARVYRIDDILGSFTLDASLTPFVPPTPPASLCN